LALFSKGAMPLLLKNFNDAYYQPRWFVVEWSYIIHVLAPRFDSVGTKELTKEPAFLPSLVQVVELDREVADSWASSNSAHYELKEVTFLVTLPSCLAFCLSF